MKTRTITYRHEQDRIDFAEFIEFKVGVDKIRPKTQKKRLDSLLAVSRLVEKPLRDLTVEDLIKVQVAIVGCPWLPETKYDRTRDLKQFIKWKKGEDSPEFKIIKTKKPPYKEIGEGEVITETELRGLEDKTDLRLSTIIEMLYQTGARPSEFCNLRIRDYRFDDGDLWFSVLGTKTAGSKREVLVKDHYSIELFKKYIERFKRVDLDDFLWVNARGEPLTPVALADQMKELKKATGFTKRFFPYWLRHSRASFLEGRISTVPFKKFFSWTSGSRMPGRYVHSGNEELKRQMNAVYAEAPGSDARRVLEELLFDEKTLDFLLERAKERRLLEKLQK